MLRQLSQPVLYPRTYGLYVALAALDILLTWAILALGGTELNRFAAWIYEAHSVTGMTFFKFATVSFVLIVCEFLGRHHDGELGRRLSRWAVIISVIPVTVAIIELTDYRLAQHADQVLLAQFDVDTAHTK